MDRYSLTKLCELLEQSPSIRRIRVSILCNSVGEVLFRIELDCDNNDFAIDDELFDINAWRRFGRVVCNITFDELRLWTLLNLDHDILASASRCIDAFINEVKHNKSVVDMDADIEFLQETSMDALNEFVQTLKKLTLRSREPLLLEQSAVLVGALGNAQQLRSLDIDCGFENAGSFEQLLEECARVEKVKVCCDISQCAAVAGLLRDPANVVRELCIELSRGRLDDTDWRSFFEQAARDILSSLVGNRQLQDLCIYSYEYYSDSWDPDDLDIDKLLCDVSSVESISNSNHTLNRLSIFECKYSDRHDTFEEKCLVLNQNKNKANVIRGKILQFYFVGDFDVSPFVDMPLSVLLEVIGQIEASEKQSAIYRLLQCTPELCNVSGRKSAEGPGNKRQKILP